MQDGWLTPENVLAVIFILLTPLVWKLLSDTLEKLGWVAGIIAALFTLLPVSLEDIPFGLNFVPIAIAVIILGITAYFSIIRKKRKIRFRSPIIVESNEDDVKTELTKAPLMPPVKYHENRHALKIEQFLTNAQTVEMVALTYNDLTVHNINRIREPLSKGANVTILILDPDSEYVNIHENMYHAAGNIRDQIRNSLRLLCDEKRNLELTNRQDRLIIRKFDYLSPHSITIINRNNPETAWIRVEDRPLGSISNERPSYTAYQKNDSEFFRIYSNEYSIIFNHSTEHSC